MKLKQIRIKNYRSIKDFRTNLSKGINVFIGPSDSGKSNVARFIRDLAFNTSATGIVTHGKDKAIGSLNDVFWARGKGTNKYKTKDGEFANTGRHSPEEVRKELGIDEVTWHKNSGKRLQFIEQFEPKFFVSYQDSTNARILGFICGIDRIYAGSREFVLKRKRVNSELGFVQERIAELKTQLKQFKHISELENKVLKVKENFKSIRTKAEKLKTIKALREEIISYKKELNALGQLDYKVIDQSRITKLLKLSNKSKMLKETLSKAEQLQRTARLVSEGLVVLEAKDKSLKEEFDKYIRSSNICPLTKTKFYSTCQRDITDNG